MKRGDRVEIRRGLWKGHTAVVTEAYISLNGEKRVGVQVEGMAPYSLAATSVRKLAGK